MIFKNPLTRWLPRLTVAAILAFVVSAAVGQEQSELSNSVDPNADGLANASVVSELSEREQNLMALIAADELLGEFVTLGPQGQSFAARFERAHEPAPKSALLVVPPYGDFIGVDPMIDAFLGEFPMNGWSVLAVQPPILPHVSDRDIYDSLADQTIGRILRAIDYLIEDGVEQIVMVGDADGAVLARRCLAENRPTAILALATIGRWAGEVGDLGIAVMELVPGRDDVALKQSERRKTEAVRIESHQHELVVVAAADSTYTGFEEEIAKRVRGWADRVTANDKSGTVP